MTHRTWPDIQTQTATQTHMQSTTNDINTNTNTHIYLLGNPTVDAHLGEVFAQGDHVHAIVSAGEEKATVGDDDQWAVRLTIVHRLIEVEVEFRVESQGIDVLAVHVSL